MNIATAELIKSQAALQVLTLIYGEEMPQVYIVGQQDWLLIPEMVNLVQKLSPQEQEYFLTEYFKRLKFVLGEVNLEVDRSLLSEQLSIAT